MWISPADINESIKLELPGSWKPKCSRCPLSPCEGKSSQGFFFLMETKQLVEEMRRIHADLPYRCMLIVPSEQRRGGLALLWKEDVDLHIQTYSPNHIDALTLNGSDPLWRLTGFYGWLKE